MSIGLCVRSLICCTLREDLLVEVSKLAREGRFDHLLVESTGLSAPLHDGRQLFFRRGPALMAVDVREKGDHWESLEVSGF